MAENIDREALEAKTYRCSRCGRGTIVKTNYCPYCGAKMDKEDA